MPQVCEVFKIQYSLPLTAKVKTRFSVFLLQETLHFNWKYFKKALPKFRLASLHLNHYLSTKASLLLSPDHYD